MIAGSLFISEASGFSVAGIQLKKKLKKHSQTHEFTQRISKARLAICSVFPKEREKQRKTYKLKYNHQADKGEQTMARRQPSWKWHIGLLVIIDSGWIIDTIISQSGERMVDRHKAKEKAISKSLCEYGAASTYLLLCLSIVQMNCSKSVLASTRVFYRGSPLCPFYTWSLSQLHCVGRADQCIIEKGVANAQFTATTRINGKR